MSLIQEDLINVAYKKLKQMVYYEKNHLFLRERLAEFECSDNFEDRLTNVMRVVMTDSPTKTKDFQDWLNKISFVLIPKGVKEHKGISGEHGTYVTNVTSRPTYEIERVNYIFEGPIELHLVAVLWLMIQGQKLEKGLSNSCMGTRLHPLVGKKDDHSAHLFKKYHELYSQWRDDGIRKARDLLTNAQQSICIIALDIQEYYYRTQVDWDGLRSKLKRRRVKNMNEKMDEAFFKRENLGERLFDCVQSIVQFYNQRIAEDLSITHPDLPNDATCLPIGLCASSLIANWYLQDFDKAILTKVRPAYYGRYVDDILLVVPNTATSRIDPIKGVIDEVLVNPGVVSWQEDDKRFELTSKPGLYLQRKKCIVQFFDANHSIAGLEKFKKEIEENASDFALLPVEGDDSPIEQVAYDILYEGSVNKLRNVKEIAENRWELAKHLSKLTQLYLVAGGTLPSRMKREIFRFFKGTNAIDYWDMWERVIAFLVISGDDETIEEFTQAIKSEIRKVEFSDTGITRLLKETLKRHLTISLEMSLAVRNIDLNTMVFNSDFWRRSNLIRHHLVSVPLLNYSNFKGDLASPRNSVQVELDATAIKWSPRFVHFDECLGFTDSGYFEITDEDSISRANSIYTKFHGSRLEDVASEIIGSNSDN